MLVLFYECPFASVRLPGCPAIDEIYRFSMSGGKPDALNLFFRNELEGWGYPQLSPENILDFLFQRGTGVLREDIGNQLIGTQFIRRNFNQISTYLVNTVENVVQ